MTNKLHTYFFLLVAVTLFFSTSFQIAYATIVPVKEVGKLLTLTEDVRKSVEGLGSMLGVDSKTLSPGDTHLFTDAANKSSVAHLLSDYNPGGIAQEICRTELVEANRTASIFSYQYGYPTGYTSIWSGGSATSTTMPEAPTSTAPDTYKSVIVAQAPRYDHIKNIIESIVVREFPEINLGPPSIALLAAMDTRREVLADQYMDVIRTLYYLPSASRLHAGRNLIDPTVTTPVLSAHPTAAFETRVNASGSLRCLLQELVEWKKLSLNLTIHQMVKEYFADSGVYIMTKRVQDLVAAATTEWAQSGIEQTIAPGVIANTSAFVDNPEAQQRRANTAIRGGVLEQIQGGSAGYQSYNLPSDNQQYIYNSVTINTADSVMDNLEMFPNKMTADNRPATLASRRALASGDFAGGGGTGGYIDYMFSTNNPIVASVEITNNTKLEMAKANENSLRQLDWGSGVLPTETCANPSDPYCRAKRVNTPASVNSVNIQEVQLMGWNNLANADEFGENPSAESQSLQIDVVTTNRGLLGYDTRNLRSPLIDPIDKLRRGNIEFIQSVSKYFDIAADTGDWAINSALHTWDSVQQHAGLEEYLANSVLLGNL